MKKLAVLVATLFVVVGVTPAQAEQASTVVIIDSGFDASLVGGQVIQEVCINTLPRACNNGGSFDDSVGAAGTTVKIHSSSEKDWNHGTIMANIVAQVNPDANIILIRNGRVNRAGRVAPGTERDLEKSLEWVIDNADKHNIVAVSFSRGSHSYAAPKSTSSGQSVASLEAIIKMLKDRGYPQRTIDRYEARLAAAKEAESQATKAAPCPAPSSLAQDIQTLQQFGVATVIAAGNDGDKVNVDTPACIDDAVTISTLARYGNDDGTQNIANNSNAGEDTDFVVSGDFNTVLGPVALSTSAATAALAGYWSKVSDGTFFGTYNSIFNNGDLVKGFDKARAVVTN